MVSIWLLHGLMCAFVTIHVTLLKSNMWSHKNYGNFQLYFIITYNMFVLMKQIFTTNVEFNGASSEVYRN